MTDNTEPSGSPLRVALVGAGAAMEAVADAANACRGVHVIARSGAGGTPGADVAQSDDARVLLTRPDVEAVLLAGCGRDAARLVTEALRRKLPTWCMPPWAAHFAQALEVVRESQQREVVFRGASWWEYINDHVWQELAWDGDLNPTYSELRVAAAAWSPGAYDGGAMLRAYPMLEALVALRGLPNTVTASVGRYRSPGGASETAGDTLAALLGYARGAAMVRIAERAPFDEQVLYQIGEGQAASLAPDEIALFRADGSTLDRRPVPENYLVHELFRFVEWVRGGAHARAGSSLDRHIAVRAILDAAVLSSQTGHPESPARLYQVQGWPLPR